MNPTTLIRKIAPARVALFALAAFASLGTAIAGPDIQHWTAATGARVFFVESHALPLVDVQVTFAAGGALDPAGAAGVASLTRSLLDAGTQGLNEQQIAERIADTGARIGGGTDKDMASLSVRTLSSEAEREAAIGLAARLLAKPTFPAEILERERARSIAGLRDALTRPDTLAARSFTRAIYGDHPYGRLVTVESLRRIKRDQIKAFHQARSSATSAAARPNGSRSASPKPCPPERRPPRSPRHSFRPAWSNISNTPLRRPTSSWACRESRATTRMSCPVRE